MSSAWLRNARCIIVAVVPGDSQSGAFSDEAVGRGLAVSALLAGQANGLVEIPSSGETIKVPARPLEQLASGARLIVLHRNPDLARSESDPFASALSAREEELRTALRARDAARLEADTENESRAVEHATELVVSAAADAGVTVRPMDWIRNPRVEIAPGIYLIDLAAASPSPTPPETPES